MAGRGTTSPLSLPRENIGFLASISQHLSAYVETLGKFDHDLRAEIQEQLRRLDGGFVNTVRDGRTAVRELARAVDAYKEAVKNLIRKATCQGEHRERILRDVRQGIYDGEVKKYNGILRRCFEYAAEKLEKFEEKRINAEDALALLSREMNRVKRDATGAELQAKDEKSKWFALAACSTVASAAVVGALLWTAPVIGAGCAAVGTAEFAGGGALVATGAKLLRQHGMQLATEAFTVLQSAMSWQTYMASRRDHLNIVHAKEEMITIDQGVSELKTQLQALSVDVEACDHALERMKQQLEIVENDMAEEDCCDVESVVQEFQALWSITPEV